MTTHDEKQKKKKKDSSAPLPLGIVDILVRGVPVEVAHALTVKAREAGVDRQTWLRARLTHLAARPTIKERYGFRMYGPGATHATIWRIGRDAHGQVQFAGYAVELSPVQKEVFHRVTALMERNEMGDREEAHDLLSKQFTTVFETTGETTFFSSLPDEEEGSGTNEHARRTHTQEAVIDEQEERNRSV